MTATVLPDTAVLIERIQRAMEDAHAEWDGDRAAKGRGSQEVATRAVVRRVWEMGFDYPHVYPRANGLGEGAQEEAELRLSRRGSSHWTWDPGTEHSALKEFQFDVSWTAYAGEYKGEDEVPAFDQLLLALESEFAGEWGVLYDFDKLLCSRADLRVMVWGESYGQAGLTELPHRLAAANGGDEGWWLLSYWDPGGFEHRVYHNGQRQD